MNWDHDDEIGEALADKYPEANYLTIDDAEIIRLVLTLPSFEGPPTPPDRSYLADIRSAWIAVMAGPEDSSPYEGLA
jgi:FeS assembly protein IscX